MQRRRHHGDLAVGGDAQALLLALHDDVGGQDRVEVARLAQAAGEGAQRELEQAPAAGPLGDVEAQLAVVQARALADREAFHPVLVVADEDERRPAQHLLAVDDQGDAEERIAPQRRQRRPHERRPLAAAEALLLALAIVNDVGVEAEARVVDEDPAVDLADVDPARPRRRRGPRPHRRARAGMPRSLAKWFSVPSGSTPKAMPVSTSAAATVLTVPSPPPATISRGRRATALPTAAAISSPPWASSISACRPAASEVAGEPVDERLVVAAARAGVDDDGDRVRRSWLSANDHGALRRRAPPRGA